MKTVQLGVIFPTKDISNNREQLMSFAPNAEALNLDFITTYDHIVGVDQTDADHYLATDCEFDETTNIHEAMILFGAMAVLTSRIRLITGCLVAPQRQTALIAKQAAEIDILSGGRLSLGVCIGWNQQEYEALGSKFKNRVADLEQQVDDLRGYWQSAVTINPSDRQPYQASIQPKPIQQPIPIWMGGLSLNALKRSAKVADGWLPLGYIDDAMISKTDLYWESAAALGRHGLGLMGRVNPWRDKPNDCLEQYQAWTEAGATHVAIGSSKGCFRSTEQYFDELNQFTELFQKHKK